MATSYTLISAKVPSIQVQTAPSGTYAYILIASPSHPSSGGTPCCSTNESRIVRSLQHGAWRWRPETTLNNYNIWVRGMCQVSVSGCIWGVCFGVCLGVCLWFCDWERKNTVYTHTHTPGSPCPQLCMDLSTALTIGQSKKIGVVSEPTLHSTTSLTAHLSALPSTSFRTSPQRTGRTSHGRDCASRNTPDQSVCRSRHDLPNQTRCQFPPFFASRKMAAPSDFKPLADLLSADD